MDKKIRPITVWLRYYFDKKNPSKSGWKHNHIVDYHVYGNKPAYMCELQRRSWVNATWMRVHSYLNAKNEVVSI